MRLFFRMSNLDSLRYFALKSEGELKMAAEIIDYTKSAQSQSLLAQNRVLRNTYWLLALSMVPTVAGAWLGMQLNVMQYITGWMGFAIFMGGSMAFMFAIEKTKNSGMGVAVLLGFTFFMGLMLSRLVGHVMGMSNGSQLIMYAFGGTAAVFFAMANLASVIKRDLTGLGKWLFAGFIVLFVGAIANMFLGSTVLMAAISTLCVAIFSAYILYDLKRVIDGGETNYITATLAIYLSIYNVFQSLLSLLGIFGGSDD